MSSKEPETIEEHCLVLGNNINLVTSGLRGIGRSIDSIICRTMDNILEVDSMRSTQLLHDQMLNDLERRVKSIESAPSISKDV